MTIFLYIGCFASCAGSVLPGELDVQALSAHQRFLAAYSNNLMISPRSSHSTAKLCPAFLLLLVLQFLEIHVFSFPQKLGDIDGDGQPTVLDLIAIVNHINGSARLTNELAVFADLNQDGVVNSQDVDLLADAILGISPLPDLPLDRILSTSPANGESGVSVKRQTDIVFTQPLSPATTITPSQFNAIFGGRRLQTLIEISSDRRKVSLFYLENIPGSAHIQVTFDASQVADFAGRLVDADGDGQPGGVAVIEFDTLNQTPLANTIVYGRVFASELAPSGSTNLSVNTPLQGVTITADGLEQQVRAVTDQLGDFRLTNAPAGQFFVHIDGRTLVNLSVGISYPDLNYYPYVGKEWTSVLGGETNIGNIYLPLIVKGTLQPVSLITNTTIVFPDSVLAQHPELDGVTVTVPANSLFGDGGMRGGEVGIAPVPPDRLPGPLPDGLSFPLVITVQTSGPLYFSEPAPVCFPNLSNSITGTPPLPPGAKSALWSFSHEIGQWQVIGPMTVSADGLLICTDPGVGIIAPGWHGAAPGVIGGGGPPGSPPSCQDPKTCGCPADQCCSNGPLPSDDGTGSNPVLLNSGEKQEQVIDLRIKGVGMDFIWARTYSSIHGPNTAQGNGWDFSYNRSVVAVGTSARISNGATRADDFRPVPAVVEWPRKYIRLGFFDELEHDTNGIYTLTHPDQRKSYYLPAGSAAGKVSQIIDRNGNTMRFAYDSVGRLTNIIDTLDRNISVAYNPSGFIESVTDFAGRSVRYSYYSDNEPGGSFGDLKSVTTPAVTGTPNGNDFPNGKTTTYTYSKGFADERLNHNLLTITDGRGSNYLQHVYSPTTDPNDPTYDKVMRQIRGGDVIDFTYLPQSPAPGNNGASLKVIVNDRVGNVTEHFFDSGSRLVLLREYTGRATDARSPTTEVANRPVGKLRPDDPDYFETRYEYNSDFMATRVIHPNGNITEYVYEPELTLLESATPIRSRGNLRQIRHLPGNHIPAGDQPVLVEQFEYDTSFGCSACGFNFVTKYTDARANVTLNQYDDRGNLITRTNRIPSIVERFIYNDRGQMTTNTLPDNGSGHHRLDTYTYYDSGPQRGYLMQAVVDTGGFNLTTRYEYDLVGNVVKKNDPRGHDTQYIVNQLNQVVREISPEVFDQSGVRYITDYFFDANNNLIRREVQNRRELLLDHGAPFVSAIGTQFGYPAADGGIVSANPVIATTYDYEILNHLIRKSEEVEPGRFIVTEYGYDANRNRNLIRYGEATAGRQANNVTLTLYDERNLPFRETRGYGDAPQSTTQFDYDGNRNRIRLLEGLESVPHLTSSSFDSFDRLVSTTDAMGNVTTNNFDPNGNRTHTTVFGELNDQHGGNGNVRLHETVFTYDANDRLIQQDVAFFNATNQAPVGDGFATTITVYSDNSQVVAVTNANNHAAITGYDTANRVLVRTDAKGNQVIYAYDSDGNVVTMTEVEKSDLGTPDESFLTSYSYDNLNRLISTTDGSGSVNRAAYDSRGNRALSVDAMTNVVRTTFDGLNRQLDTIREMVDRVGVPPVKSTIVTRQLWDDSSRLVAQIDDNIHATTYLYDSLNRKFATVYADFTGQTNLLDVHGNSVLFTDANGNSVTNRFDGLDRLIRRDVAVGPGVSADTTWEEYHYDGLSRLTYAANNASVVVRNYDSLGNVLQDIQGTNVVGTVYDSMGNQTQLFYPGGRVIATAYDELERKQTISDASGVIASYFYVGPSRVTRRDYSNGTRCDYSYDGITGVPHATNDFGFKHITRTRHSRIADNTAIDDRSYAWDRMGNKTRHQDATVRRDYAYDSAYRLIRSTRSDTGAITYRLDGAQNRLAVAGGPDPGNYTLDPTMPEPADAQLNQYTTTPFDTRQYDLNGNFVAAQETGRNRILGYDFRNRLVRVTDPGTNAVFAYDALNRRVSTQVNGVTTAFYYDGWRTVEEQAIGGAATYVYGLYLDEVLQMRRGEVAWYYHADDLYSVRALTDASTQVAESYDYSDYGEPSAAGTLGNPYLFTGHRFDVAVNIYYVKNRYLDSTSGRFITRDRTLWHDVVNFGNGSSYAGSSPMTRTDPTGLDVRIYSNKPHEIIAIDTSDGIVTFGFGSDWPMLLSGLCSPGRIDEGNAPYSNIAHAKEIGSYPLSIEKGDRLANKLRQLKMNPPIYCFLSFNCNTFANTVANVAVPNAPDISFLPFDYKQIQ